MWYWKGILAIVLVYATLPMSVAGEALSESSVLSNITRGGYLKFNLTAGRIVVTGRQFGAMSSSSNSGKCKEKISVQNSTGEPSLTYERSGEQEELSIQIVSGDRLKIRRQDKGNSDVMRFEFIQNPNEPVLLKLGPADQGRACRSASLWHLLIMQPDECRQYVIPVLELLRPQWKLAEAAKAVEAELLRLAAAGEPPSHRQWAAFVEQLGNDQFAKRESADRQLRAAGPSVVGYLRQLDLDRLDAEQQFRLRRIIASLSEPAVDDTADRVAPTLLHDAAIWLALLARPEESTRRVAANQLAVILGRPIDFDPSADARTRQDQIERIRAQTATNELKSRS